MKKTHLVPLIAVISAVIIVGAAIACWLFFSGTLAPRTTLTVLDAKGQPLAQISALTDLKNESVRAYCEVAVTEAAAVLAEQQGCTEEAALEQLFGGEYVICTAFDELAFEALKNAGASQKKELSMGGAITDLKGNLIAVYSSSASNGTNYATRLTSPYSSIKPLSVYTPALEKGLIHWTSRYEDSPYKQSPGSDGTMQDWPENSTGTYSMENVGMYDAIRYSLNTVAVKCLKDVGVRDSITFLQENFGLPLTVEQQIVDSMGEEELIGNIALGYLDQGVSPVNMAGYYQIFATGGSYTEPKAVTAIRNAAGKTLYTRQYDSRQVVSRLTADTMNKLLQGVVKTGGTGQSAACPGIAVAGKTGTGDQNAGNWFVGVTPGYSCAIWHDQSESNRAGEIFRAVISQIYAAQPKANRNFITHVNLYQVVYCTESGQAISPFCTTIDTGYFADPEALPICSVHGNQNEEDQP